jgi:AbrB family looped-hinge helix DNA binding protein
LARKLVLVRRAIFHYELCMKITSKGTVTIPQEVRDKCGLLPNTEVEFHINRAGKAVLVPTKSGSTMSDWLKEVAGTAKGRFTTDEVMRMTRGED